MTARPARHMPGVPDSLRPQPLFYLRNALQKAERTPIFTLSIHPARESLHRLCTRISRIAAMSDNGSDSMDWLWIAAIAALWVATAEAALWLHRAAWPHNTERAQ